jgi:hypothetical protein
MRTGTAMNQVRRRRTSVLKLMGVQPCVVRWVDPG